MFKGGHHDERYLASCVQRFACSTREAITHEGPVSTFRRERTGPVASSYARRSLAFLRLLFQVANARFIPIRTLTVRAAGWFGAFLLGKPFIAAPFAFPEIDHSFDFSHTAIL